jgi:hypothetical protein
MGACGPLSCPFAVHASSTDSWPGSVMSHLRTLATKFMHNPGLETDPYHGHVEKYAENSYMWETEFMLYRKGEHHGETA